MCRARPKILMIISSLSGGGAERVAVLLAEGFVEQGCEVALVTIYGRQLDFYSVPKAVDRIALDLGRERSNLVQKLTGNVRRILALRRAIRRVRPDLVLSLLNQTNVLTLLAAEGLGLPVIVTEHMDPRRDGLPAAWRWLRRKTYPWATRLVSVSPAVDSFFTWLPEERRRTIPNPVAFEQIESQRGCPVRLRQSRTVIAMGRLSPEKGFDLLIRAFARLAAEFPDWGLAILGEGPERGSLESLAQDLKLGDRLQMPGAVEEPFAVLKQSDVFVLSSRHEGFGNVLVEAMACGLPVVAADCWAVSPAIVRDGTDGLLVPPDNPAALAQAMARLMRDEALRKELAHSAGESARRFALPEVMVEWGRVLNEVCPTRESHPE